MSTIKSYLSSLATWDFLFLTLMIISLPSLEAPKNIFLICYVTLSSIGLIINRRGLKWDKWDSMFLILMLSGFASTIFAGMPNQSEWKGFGVLLTMLSVGWLLSKSTLSKRKRDLLVTSLVFGAIPPTILGLINYILLHNASHLQLHSVGHVNHSAIYLSMVFGTSLGLLFSKNPDWFKKTLYTLTSIFFLTALILTESRAAVGVGFLTYAILSLFIFKNIKSKFLSIAFMSTVIMIIVAFDTGVIQKELNNQKRGDILGGRQEIWNVSFEAARISPLFGLGMSNTANIRQEDIKRSVENRHLLFKSSDYIFQGHSHSLYLTALVDRGILGLLATLYFMYLWASTLKKSFWLMSKNTEKIVFWAGSMSAWISTFIIGTVNTTFHHEHGILACILLGLHLNSIKKTRQL